MNARVLLVLVAVWGHAALETIADEWRFEVAADAPPVVSCPVDDGAEPFGVIVFRAVTEPGRI